MSERSRDASPVRSEAVLLAAMLLAPLVLRGALLAHAEAGPGLADLRGVVADLAAGALFAGVAALAARAARPAAAAVAALWSLLCYADYEHVRALGANAALAHAGFLADETFREGSALAPSAPVVLGALVAGAALLAAWGGRRGSPRPRLRSFAFVAGVALALLLVWPNAPEAVAWRQSHALWQNLGSLRTGALLPPAGSGRPLPRDLSGPPRFELGRADRNVLLVVVEGLSGAYLEPVAAANGRSPPFPMPELNRWAERGLLYTSFVAQQRQTNRGEYALLCGELPKLRTTAPKMSNPAADGELPCLPRSLAAAGYRTAYLQAAPLAFMMKDRFMPKAGFQRTLGSARLERAYARNKWGVDDRAFFEQAAERVRSLRAEEGPWFLTLLTAGTHHPYNVPEGFAGPEGTDDRARAFAYADRAVGAFLEHLEAEGVLEDTLVLVTSDESAGVHRGVSGRIRQLSQSWGALLVLAPEGVRGRVDAPFAQVDLALSVLDYLGLAERGPSFRGRSIFRRYETPRALPFANTYARLVGMLAPSGRLYVCGEALERCTAYATRAGRPFAVPLQPAEHSDPAELHRLRELVARSEGAPVGRTGRYVLLEAGPVHLRPDVRDLQYLFGGQELSVPARTEIRVALDLRVRGEGRAATLQHDLTSEGGRLFYRALPKLRPGDAVHLEYRYRTRRARERVRSRLWATRVRGAGLELVVERATLTLRPHSGPEAPPGLHVDRAQVSRRAKASAPAAP